VKPALQNSSGELTEEHHNDGISSTSFGSDSSYYEGEEELLGMLSLSKGEAANRKPSRHSQAQKR